MEVYRRRRHFSVGTRLVKDSRSPVNLPMQERNREAMDDDELIAAVVGTDAPRFGSCSPGMRHGLPRGCVPSCRLAGLAEGGEA
jgi:hypothetical protein